MNTSGLKKGCLCELGHATLHKCESANSSFFSYWAILHGEIVDLFLEKFDLPVLQ